MSKYSNWRDPKGALQARLYGLVDSSLHQGITARETYVRFSTNPNHPEFAHHGWISGALATLHHNMKIARLAEKRDGSKIYVHPDFIDSRKVEAQGRGGPSKDEVIFGQSLVSLLEYWMQIDTEGARFTTDRTKAERNQRLFFQELKSIWETRPDQ